MQQFIYPCLDIRQTNPPTLVPKKCTNCTCEPLMKNIENNNGGYDLEGVIWHQHSNRLMKMILELWPDKKTAIVDLGCGHNFYVTVLLEAGYTAMGYDAKRLHGIMICQIDLTEEINDHFLIEECHIEIRDQQKSIEKHWVFPIHDKIRNIISLEVGEHIPYEKSFIYLNNLVKISNGGDILMSWAILGQAGHGHINCQENVWVEKNMSNRGYDIDHKKTLQLRDAVVDCHCSWFKNTLMYFTPKK